MALIQCSSCQELGSDKTGLCTFCGSSLQRKVADPGSALIAETQRTSRPPPTATSTPAHTYADLFNEAEPETAPIAQTTQKPGNAFGAAIGAALLIWWMLPDTPEKPAAFAGSASESSHKYSTAEAARPSSEPEDLAWHAQNSYGWNCPAIVSRSDDQGGFFYVKCSSGKYLRVYPRAGTYSRITNEDGGFDGY